MSTVAENKVLAAALEYAGLGWQVVPIYGLRGAGCQCKKQSACKSAGKHPRIMEWQKNATDDEETIDDWFGRWPTSNVGVRLGPQSGIVDIEFDDDEGRQVAEKLLGECHTPTYTSGRSVHRLFKFGENLPQQKTVTKISGLEFRFGTEDGGAQSVMPPSRHFSGKQYEWLPGLSPAEVGEVADVPDSILAIIYNLRPGESAVKEERTPSARHKLYEQPKILETVDGRDSVFHAESCAMWREQVAVGGAKCFDDPRVQARVFERLWALNQVKCVPPLTHDEIVGKCNGGRDFIKKQANDDRSGKSPTLTDLGLEFHDGEFWPGLWRVECVNSDPPLIRLFAPFLPKQFIELLPEEYDSANRVHLAVFGATGTIYLNDGVRPWEMIWKGVRKRDNVRRALAAKLLDDAKKVEAPSEVKRQAVLAQFILGFIYEKQLMVKEPDDEVKRRDNRFMRGGDVWIHFDAMLEHADFRRSDKINRNDLSRCIRGAGAKDRWAMVGNRRKHFMVLNQSGLDSLTGAAELSGDGAHTNTAIYGAEK